MNLKSFAELCMLLPPPPTQGKGLQTVNMIPKGPFDTKKH